MSQSSTFSANSVRKLAASRTTVFALSWSTKRTLPSAAIQIGFPDPSSANTTPSMGAPWKSLLDPFAPALLPQLDHAISARSSS